MKFGLLLWLLALPAVAAETADNAMPEIMLLDGRSLVLNGIGTRTISLLEIKIYVAALYVAVKESDSRKLIASTSPRVIQMQFLRNISRESTVKAWEQAFAANCKAPCVPPRAPIRAFLSQLPDSRTGDVQIYCFYVDRVEILHNGEHLVRVEGGEFVRLLLSTWIGAEPPTPELKQALLGLPES